MPIPTACWVDRPRYARAQGAQARYDPARTGMTAKRGGTGAAPGAGPASTAVTSLQRSASLPRRTGTCAAGVPFPPTVEAPRMGCTRCRCRSASVGCERSPSGAALGGGVLGGLHVDRAGGGPVRRIVDEHANTVSIELDEMTSCLRTTGHVWFGGENCCSSRILPSPQRTGTTARCVASATTMKTPSGDSIGVFVVPSSTSTVSAAVPVNPCADEYRHVGCCSDGPCSGPPPSWK